MKLTVFITLNHADLHVYQTVLSPDSNFSESKYVPDINQLYTQWRVFSEKWQQFRRVTDLQLLGSTKTLLFIFINSRQWTLQERGRIHPYKHKLVL